jgi:hypothetical protein
MLSKDMNFEDKKVWGGGTAYLCEWMMRTIEYNSLEGLVKPSLKMISDWRDEFENK